MGIVFHDYRAKVKGALNDSTISYLYEVGGEVEAQVKRNSRVDTGQTKNSWRYEVDENNGICTIGSPLQNAIWEEFGTGEYALNGDGRKGGWVYEDEKGETHFTYGKTPNRALHNAFVAKKATIIKRATQILKGIFR